MNYKQFAVTLAILTIPASADLGVVITELHRDPAAGNKTAIPGGYSHSFIELTNFSRDTFFLQDVFLTNGKVVDSIMLFDVGDRAAARAAPAISGAAANAIPGHESCVFGAAYIPPGGIAVILPQNYRAGLEAAPSSIHPIAPGTFVLTVNHKNLGGGMANDDGAALYRGTRARIDSLVDLAADPGVFVSAPLSGKIVLSQKQPKGVSVVPSPLLLGDRRYAVSSGEPLSPGRFGTFGDGLYTEYSATMSAGAVRCSIAGVFAAEGAGVPWRFYSRLSTSLSRAAANPHDSPKAAVTPAGGAVGAGFTPARLSQSAADIGSGVFGADRRFLLTFDIAPEQRQYFFEVYLAGRTITVPIDLSSFWADAGTLRITEIYPKGSASADQPEWFELQNVSAAAVNICGWMFGNGKDTAVIAAADYFLPPGEFLVICKDSAAMLRKYRSIRHLVRPARWHTLNSYNDTLRVWSPRGVEVDAAVYRSAWFKGWTSQSLERVFGGGSGADSASWALCDRPTPGLPGNAGEWRAVSSPSMEAGPTPFTPNGDGVDDYLSIKMKIPPNYKVKVRIFAFDGKLLKTFTGESPVITWDGKTETDRPAAPGPIYIIAEFTSGGARKTVRKNGVLWR